MTLPSVGRQLSDHMRDYWLGVYRVHGGGGKCPFLGRKCAQAGFAAAVLIEAGVWLGDRPNGSGGQPNSRDAGVYPNGPC